MSNLINSQPRFGLESENGLERIFDYATGLYHTIEGDDTVIESTDGAWDARAIANCIRTQAQVFDAFIETRDGHELDPDDVDEAIPGGKAAKLSRRRIREADQTAEERAHRDKVEQARRDFAAEDSDQRTEQALNETTGEVQTGAAGEDQRGPDGLTNAERQQREEEQRKQAEEEQRRQQASQQQNQGGQATG